MDSFDICTVIGYWSKVLQNIIPTPLNHFEVKTWTMKFGVLSKYSDSLLVHDALDGFSLYMYLN